MERAGKEARQMSTRSSLMTAWGAVLGLVLTTATLLALPRGGREYLTFSGPVQLPGVTLEAGSYIFEVADLASSSDLIRVRNKATYRVVFAGFTLAVERPADLRRDQSVVFGEAPKGVPPPILAWYPLGERSGHQFIHKTGPR
jgi:hypothetical protein